MKPSQSRLRRGFTLIELIVVIAILGLLVALLLPAMAHVFNAADDTKCAGNLRQLAVIIQTAAQDNDNRFPQIENDRSDPMHDGKVETLADLVQAQGGTTAVLKCPADLRNGGSATGRKASYFQLKGASYEWQPFYEGESVSNPVIRTPFGQFTVPLSRVRLLMDYAEGGEGPHDRAHAGSSAMNVLYADGSVRKIVLGDN